MFPSDNKSLISHPFFVSTTVSANVSWLVAFVAQIIAATKFGRSAVSTLWLAIVLQLLVNASMLYGLVNKSVPSFRLQISVLAAMCVVLGALGIDNNLFTRVASREAIAAAWIILSIVDLLWIIVLTSEQSSPMLQVFNEGARIRLSSESNERQIIKGEADMEMPNVQSTPKASDLDSAELLPPRPITMLSTATTPLTPKSENTVIPSKSSYPVPSIAFEGSKPSFNSRPPDPTNDHQSTKSKLTVPTSIATRGSSNAPSSNYSYSQQALALYDYTASSENVDASGEGELSFRKGEMLEVSRTVEKKWWPARKTNGQVGVVPSNYLQVL